jgi:2'-5' RNA ligase
MPASAEAWRSFIAVPVPAGLRNDLAAAVTTWRGEPDAPDLRWTDPDGWHVTLAFLGQTDPARIPDLIERLTAAVCPLAPFIVATGRLGAFPRPGQALSVWVGIEDPDRSLRELAAAVQVAVLEPDQRRPLHGHLTVGRSRARRGEPLAEWIAAHAFPPATLPVEEVVLYRSHLGRGPARYEALGRVRLGSVRD